MICTKYRTLTLLPICILRIIICMTDGAVRTGGMVWTARCSIDRDEE